MKCVTSTAACYKLVPPPCPVSIYIPSRNPVANYSPGAPPEEPQCSLRVSECYLNTSISGTNLKVFLYSYVNGCVDSKGVSFRRQIRWLT